MQPFTEAISSGAERSLSDSAGKMLQHFSSHSVPEKSGRQIWTICFLVNIFSTKHSIRQEICREVENIPSDYDSPADQPGC